LGGGSFTYLVFTDAAALTLYALVFPAGTFVTEGFFFAIGLFFGTFFFLAADAEAMAAESFFFDIVWIAANGTDETFRQLLWLTAFDDKIVVPAWEAAVVFLPFPGFVAFTCAIARASASRVDDAITTISWAFSSPVVWRQTRYSLRETLPADFAFFAVLFTVVFAEAAPFVGFVTFFPGALANLLAGGMLVPL
jgi:hypothetical protein